MCKHKKNFSWPVNGTSRQNYEAFCSWFTQHENAVRTRRLVIWGAGSRGSEFASIMMKMDFHDFLFVDSNPQVQGGCVCGVDVIAPSELENHRGKIILVSPESSSEIEAYLDLHDYHRDSDYFLIKNYVDDLYVKEFLRPYHLENLILGSCEFTAISIHDEDIRSMEDMLFQTLGKDSTKILTVHGIGLRAQYNIFHAQIASGMKPKRLLLQISMDTLIAKDHLFPHTQHVELLKKLLETQRDPADEFLEYFETACERSKNPLMDMFSSQGEKQPYSKAKIRNYFQYYYMRTLEREAEGLAYLVKLLDEASENNVDVMLFVLPVNYQLARELFSDEFENKYEENLSEVKETTKGRNVCFLDLSYRLESRFFAWPEAPNASLNSQGRQVVTRLLCRAIEEMR
ncbi:MAG: hypothetical protein HDR27_00025 [Lachnospiraceae bacterium]|nr:hypothetical protein [Lachnospiraceae bacterium]